MEQEQYEAMQIIMQSCRTFAAQMEKCLANTGLMEKGFKLIVNVGQAASKMYGTWSDVELSEYMIDVGEEQYKKTRMKQYKLGNGDWSVQFDPKAKAGTVPENYGSKTATNDINGVAETSEHPYPPDNLWLSSRGYCPFLGGGQ